MRTMLCDAISAIDAENFALIDAVKGENIIML